MKKLMSLLLALIMVIGTLTVPAFAYSDIEDGTPTSEAITILTDLDILHGFVDGSFKPDDTITRAQMATVICNVLGYGKIGQTTTIFKDVPKEHWASGYIGMINGLGIVAGYGNGYYGPEDPVTYEQVAKIIVSTLGYTPMANEQGGWYHGYLSVANRLDVTDNVPMMIGKPAPRGAVATMVYNALDVDMMEQVGFGSYAYYKVIEDKTLLSNNLDIAKVEALVKVVDFANKEAEITISKVDPAYKEISVGNKTFDTAIDLAPYKNLSCTLYLDMSGRTPVIVSAIADDSVDSITLTNKQIDSISGDKISYYKNIDDKRTQSITLDSDYEAYLNNGNDSVDLADYFGAKAKDYSTMTFIDADNNGKYETVIIEVIESFVVSSVNIRTNTIVVNRTAGHTYNSNKLVLNDDVSYTMNIALADIEVGDVVNVKTSKINGDYHYDIIVTNDTVTGTVNAKDANYYYIDDEPYTALTTVRLGDTGVFTVDMAGNILAIDKTATQTSVKWGYVIATHADTGLDNEYVIKIATIDGKEEVFDFAARVRVEDADAAKIETTFADKISDKYNNKLVAYKLNSRDEVTAIYSTTDAIAEYVDDSFVVKNVGTKLTYKADGRLGSYYVSNDAMIFSVDNNNEVKVVSSTGLRATENYEITTVVYDASTNDLIVALGKNIEATVDPASPVMLVESIGYAINDMIIVEGYVDGEIVEFMYDSNEFNVTVKKGDLVQYTLVGDKAIGMNIICNVTDKVIIGTTKDKVDTNSAEALNAYIAGHDRDFFIYKGIVAGIRGINVEFKDRDARVTMPDGNYGVYKYTSNGRIYANEFIEDVDTESIEGAGQTKNQLLVVKYDNVPLIAVIVDN